MNLGIISTFTLSCNDNLTIKKTKMVLGAKVYYVQYIRYSL